MTRTSETAVTAGPRGGTASREELLGLLHDVGHELATLGLLAEVALGDPELRGSARERVDTLEHHTSRLLDVVRTAVVGGPATGDGDRAVDVRAVLEQIVSLVALSSTTRVTVLPGERVWLRAEENLLWRMVTNLVDNAIRAAGPQGKVTVSVACKGSVLIEVADDGPGIDSARSGWGSLGLGIVNGLAETCDGRLLVVPADRGGTRAVLEFPAPNGIRAVGGATDRRH